MRPQRQPPSRVSCVLDETSDETSGMAQVLFPGSRRLQRERSSTRAPSLTTCPGRTPSRRSRSGQTKNELVELAYAENEASRPRERAREGLANRRRPERLAFALGRDVVDRMERRDQVAGDLE